VWEEGFFSQLMDLLQHKILTRDDDSWVCEIGADGGFVVKDGDCFLSKNFLPGPDWNMDLGCAVKKVWKSLAPSKIVIFLGNSCYKNFLLVLISPVAVYFSPPRNCFVFGVIRRWNPRLICLRHVV
jgi:hypothetical protein